MATDDELLKAIRERSAPKGSIPAPGVELPREATAEPPADERGVIMSTLHGLLRGPEGLTEAEEAKAREGMASLLGGYQGLTLGGGKHIISGLRALPRALKGEGLGEAYRSELKGQEELNRDFREESPLAYGGAEALASLAVPLPGAGKAQGLAKVGRMALQGAGIGGVQGFLGSEGETLTERAKDAAMSGALGLGLGGAFAGGGELAGKLGGRLLKKAAAAKEKIGALATEVVDAEQRSLRSAAGNAAQDAYKQVENLVKSGEINNLTPEEQAVAAKLLKELGQSAKGKLSSSAAKKAETAEALAEAGANRASKIEEAEKRIANPLNQIMPRLKRYGPPLLGSAIGAIVGGPFGPAVGALAGAGSRPAVQAVMRGLRHPSVGGPLAKAAGYGLKGGAAVAPIAARASVPLSVDALNISREDDRDERTAALLQYLRGGQ